MHKNVTETDHAPVVKEKTGGQVVYQSLQLTAEVQGIGGSAPAAQITRR
jgi:hypothetical protein